MEERDKKTELLVGLFLLVGLLLVSGLILEFSSVREVFKGTYEITSTFPDGSGIGDSTPVILGGSKIGKVKGKPILNEKFNGVIITMEIYNTIHIPSDAKFTIGTAGLLGDSFIEIKPTGKETNDYVKPGASVAGESSKLSGLQNTAEEVAKKVNAAVDDIRDAVKDLRTSLKNINDGALSENSMKDLKDTFHHIDSVATRLDEKTFGDETSKDVKEAIASFKNAAHSLDEAAKDFHPTMAKIDGVVERADKVMVSADNALKTIDKTAGSLGETAKDLSNDLRKGHGLLPALLGDERLKLEFKQLISNLNEHGVLFYRNDATKREAEEQVQQAKSRASSSSNRNKTPR